MGEVRATAALEATALHLGAGLAVVINTLNPALIYVGGEIAEVWDQLLPTIRGVISKRVLTDSAAATPLVAEAASTYPRLRGGTALVAAPLFAAPRIA